MFIFRNIPRTRFEEVKQLNFYKRHLFGNFHLVTVFGVAGDKRCRLWKRILSHVYVIVYVQIVDDPPMPRCLDPLPPAQVEELNKRIEEF